MNLFYLTSLLFLGVPILGYTINNRKFPPGFLFGAATSAYQVEGGWNEDGKGENVWDRLTHEHPDFINNHESGDITCDSYHKYKDDIAILKEMNASHYRFSLSWSRILPNGYPNQINQAGVKYYRTLMKELLDNNIIPLVTIFHWDTPQPLQDIGGWTNIEIVDYYAEYARICFQLFGDLVKHWVTINEPKHICHDGYGIGSKAPAIVSAQADFLCSHHVLLGHAKAYHIYNDTFRSVQKGIIGIVIDSPFFMPASNSSEDIAAAETAQQFSYGWYANPVVYGDYPEVMKEHLERRSKAAGYKKSILPVFTESLSKGIKGTYDFLGVNFYTSNLCRPLKSTNNSVFWQDTVEVDNFLSPTWNRTTDLAWFRVTPWGIRGLVNWVSKTYNNVSIIITENGMPDNGTTLEDDVRVNFIQSHLSNLLDAMFHDNNNVFGYTHWSLMNNLEWKYGYSQRFGLYHVDFNSPNRTRTPKKSAHYFAKVIKTRCLVDKCVD